MELNKKLIEKFLKDVDGLVSTGPLTQRKLDYYEHKSYDDEKYKVVFFAVEGSPTLLYGTAVSCKYDNKDAFVINSNRGKFYYFYKKDGEFVLSKNKPGVLTNGNCI